MKKFYFLFLFALIASISNLYAAEVVLWEEDFSSGKLTGYVVGNGGGTTKIISEKLAKGTAPELLIAKKRRISSGYSFRLERIVWENDIDI